MRISDSIQSSSLFCFFDVLLASRRLFFHYIVELQWLEHLWNPENILQETSNPKSELVLLEWTPRLCLLFVLYDVRLFNTIIITLYGVMNYCFLMPNSVTFYVILNEI